jgi:squalene-hopene/tetraprenyl-beta-curcumene cyclase
MTAPDDASAATAPGRPLPPDVAARIGRAQALAQTALLAERTPGGTWVGELSASALSTATAVTALLLVGRGDPAAAARHEGLVARGFAWLVGWQNPDGGWGDTTRSISNISTTTLVWAALGLGGAKVRDAAPAVAAAERWLVRAAGSVEPEALVRAIEGRYGRDRTFSIPILTMCALCGRLGPGRDAWGHVRQLPFEVAALPQRWFGALRLPVVSYALPALIAIGQVRHGLRPTANPVLRALRDRCRSRTLETLGRLQPANGGFLEATPLTSFVTMSLAAIGLHAHPVARRGTAFLEASARPDGSWPIDTNLATWVTTLAVQALTPAGESDVLPADDRTAIRDWLLGQQYRHEHPYTLAAPGGWAWTDLPGGVPDADDTAGALLALRRLEPGGPASLEAAQAGIGWLLSLQNRDGGIPTFCRGWGALPFDRSSPDITAHALRAWTAWREALPPAGRERVAAASVRARAFLRRTQRADGAWIPLWFGHLEDARDENPLYGTARVVPALCDGAGTAGADTMCGRALRWIVAQQGPDGGWSGTRGAASSMEETALALEALAVAWESGAPDPELRRDMASALQRGATWIAAAVERRGWTEPAPIGFYFAKLWYHERLYPLIFATGALTRLARLR